MKTFFESISAGVLITIGGAVFLACDSRYMGAVFFSVALLCICYKGYALFTGRIGYFVEDHTAKNVKNLVICLVGNLLATFLLGMLLRFAIPSMGDAANTLCANKLTQNIVSTLIRAFFCGILMYLAVSIYKEKNTVVGILFCVPVFILAGFEHSIADMFYFGASGIFDLKVLYFMAAVVVGNTFGGMLLPLIGKVGKKDEKK
ncbi:MAG: formate/nitrite transporter family protein [Clostridia bacterium]|nr:formate/nitrite transporter family protein [Clostridia bacterium]